MSGREIERHTLGGDPKAAGRSPDRRSDIADDLRELLDALGYRKPQPAADKARDTCPKEATP